MSNFLNNYRNTVKSNNSTERSCLFLSFPNGYILHNASTQYQSREVDTGKIVCSGLCEFARGVNVMTLQPPRQSRYKTVPSPQKTLHATLYVI